MPKFNVWMKVVAATCICVEADTPEEAMEKAVDEYGESPVNICHQCSVEMQEPVITEAVDAVLIG